MAHIRDRVTRRENERNLLHIVLLHFKYSISLGSSKRKMDRSWRFTDCCRFLRFAHRNCAHSRRRLIFPRWFPIRDLTIDGFYHHRGWWLFNTTKMEDDSLNTFDTAFRLVVLKNTNATSILILNRRIAYILNLYIYILLFISKEETIIFNVISKISCFKDYL